VNLTEFLTARLDEDEASARAVRDNSSPWRGQWRAADGHFLETYSGLVLALAPGFRSTDQPGEFAPGVLDHIARHDPARALREVEAKRRILSEHSSADSDWCHACESGTGACMTLRILADVYSGHPGCRDEWNP
jgi:hypothetical protein